MAATSGQTINDRLNAVRYALAGQGLARTVCKATTEEVLAPKKKHIDYLLACTEEPNVSIPQLANLLIDRTQHTSWAVVFKALISIHHLLNFGNERFTQYLATSNHSFELNDFMDRTTPQGYGMSTFVRRYAKYVNDKIGSYKTLAIDLCKIKPGKDNALRTMNMDKLSKTLPVVHAQFDALLEFGVEQKDLNNGIIMAAFKLLYKDLNRIFAAYQEAIINLVERYFKLSRKKASEALAMYRKYLDRMDKVAAFFKIVEQVGLDKNEMPDTSKLSSLLGVLEEHLAQLEAKKRGTTPASPEAGGDPDEADELPPPAEAAAATPSPVSEPPATHSAAAGEGGGSPRSEKPHHTPDSPADTQAPRRAVPPARPSPKVSPKVSPSEPKSAPGGSGSGAGSSPQPEKKASPPERPAKPPSRPPPPAAAPAAAATPAKQDQPPAGASPTPPSRPPPAHPAPPRATSPAARVSSPAPAGEATAAAAEVPEEAPAEANGSNGRNAADQEPAAPVGDNNHREEAEGNGQNGAAREAGGGNGDEPGASQPTCSTTLSETAGSGEATHEAQAAEGAQPEAAEASGENSTETNHVNNGVANNHAAQPPAEDEQVPPPPPPPPLEDEGVDLAGPQVDGDENSNDENHQAAQDDVPPPPPRPPVEENA